MGGFKPPQNRRLKRGVKPREVEPVERVKQTRRHHEKRQLKPKMFHFTKSFVGLLMALYTSFKQIKTSDVKGGNFKHQYQQSKAKGVKKKPPNQTTNKHNGHHSIMSSLFHNLKSCYVGTAASASCNDIPELG